MCYHYSLKTSKIELEKQYSLKISEEVNKSLSTIHVSAFEEKQMPVITDLGIQLQHWGLIPHWAKKKELTYPTANAKAESLNEKPTWKLAISSQRCLVPATGFFEWRHEGKQKYPYYINVKNQSLFSFAGIWDQWINPINHRTHYSFSIITTSADEVMDKIHNTKKRMPYILNKKDESTWLNKNTSSSTIKDILSNPTAKLNGITIRKDFINHPTPKTLSLWEYPELSLIDLF